MQELTIFFNNHPLLCSATIVVLILVILFEWQRTKQNLFNISPAQVTQLINREQAIVIDIRKKEAYQLGHIVHSHLYQAEDILADAKKLDKFRTQPIIIIAEAKHDGQKVAAFLLKNGYNAFSLAGGISAWKEAQMPLVKE